MGSLRERDPTRPFGRLDSRLECPPGPRACPRHTHPTASPRPHRPRGKRIARWAILVVTVPFEASPALGRGGRCLERGPSSPPSFPSALALGRCQRLAPTPGGSLIPLRGTALPSEEWPNPAAGKARDRTSKSSPVTGLAPPRPGPLSSCSRSAGCRPSAPVPLDAPPPWTGEEDQPAGAGVAAGWTPLGSLGRSPRPDPAGAGCGLPRA